MRERKESRDRKRSYINDIKKEIVGPFSRTFSLYVLTYMIIAKKLILFCKSLKLKYTVVYLIRMTIKIPKIRI